MSAIPGSLTLLRTRIIACHPSSVASPRLRARVTFLLLCYIGSKVSIVGMGRKGYFSFVRVGGGSSEPQNQQHLGKQDKSEQTKDQIKTYLLIHCFPANRPPLPTFLFIHPSRASNHRTSPSFVLSMNFTFSSATHTPSRGPRCALLCYSCSVSTVNCRT